MTKLNSRVITHSHETLSTVIYNLLSTGKISPEVCDDLITSVLNTETSNIYQKQSLKKLLVTIIFRIFKYKD